MARYLDCSGSGSSFRVRRSNPCHTLSARRHRARRHRRFITLSADLSGSIKRREGILDGPLRSARQPVGDAPQGGDPGSRQRVLGRGPRRAERVARPERAQRGVGDVGQLRRLHAVHAPAGTGVEPAEPGQSVPDLEAAGINVKVVAAISEELFEGNRRPTATACCRRKRSRT